MRCMTRLRGDHDGREACREKKKRLSLQLNNSGITVACPTLARWLGVYAPKMVCAHGDP